jgi:NAD(P)-dependent dehydrogenase (short-subunit alcohol dehydrogenase family)
MRAAKPMNQQLEPKKRLEGKVTDGTNEEVARLALFLASDEASYCSGGIHMIDGGYAAG